MGFERWGGRSEACRLLLRGAGRPERPEGGISALCSFEITLGR
jgi:hypothetical protein